MRIEKLVEQHKQMWAAFEKLNEKLEEKQTPYGPKDGEYVVANCGDDIDWIRIHKKTYYCHVAYCSMTTIDDYISTTGGALGLHYKLRPATPEEKQLLDNKLKEQGKRWNAEKKCIEDIPTWKVGDWFIPHKQKEDKHPFWIDKMDKYDGIPMRVNHLFKVSGIDILGSTFNFHPDWCEKTEEPKKEPKIGEHHIFFNSNNELAIIATLDFIDDTRNVKSRYKASDNRYYDNCIPFESIEQYKNFIENGN